MDIGDERIEWNEKMEEEKKNKLNDETDGTDRRWGDVIGFWK